MLETDLDGTTYYIRFHHHQFNELDMVHSNGYPIRGETTCVITKQGFVPVSVGVAFCSNQDRFVKAEGRKLALKRALASASRFENDKQARAKIWESYFSRNK